MLTHLLFAVVLPLTPWGGGPIAQPVHQVIKPVIHHVIQRAPVENQAIYHQRLIAELCAVKPVFCGWTP